MIKKLAIILLAAETIILIIGISVVNQLEI